MKNQTQRCLENSRVMTAPSASPVMSLLTLIKRSRRLILSGMLVLAGTTSAPAFAVPGPPSTPNMTDASDSGHSFTDNITSIPQPIFSGTGIAFSSLILYADAIQVGFAIVPPSGQWTIAPNTKLSDGTHAMTVKQTSGGLQSAASGHLNIVIDTIKPAAPSRPDLLASSDHGNSDTDNLTNTTLPTFQGTAGPGAFISLYNTTVSSVASIGAATASSQGNWQGAVTVGLPTGDHSCLIAAQARDAAGNASPLSTVLAIGVDTIIPATATKPDLIAADDSGVSNSDDITKVTTPSFTVKTEPYGKVDLFGFNTVLTPFGTAIADGYGLATVKVTKPLNTNYSVYAINYDRSGNKASALTPTLALFVDTVAPNAPSKPLLDPNSDSGVIQDNITNIKIPSVHGQSSDPGVLDVSFFAGIFTYHAKAPVKFSAWSATAPVLPDGVYDVTATNTDVAGNSSISPVYQLTIDTKPPAVPSAPDLSHFGDSGVSSSDNLTNENPLELEGTSQSALKITIYNNGIPIVTQDASADQWLIKTKLTNPGPFHVSASATDAAGNVSAQSPQLAGILDLSAPSSTLKVPSATLVKNLNLVAGTAQDSTVNSDATGIDKITVGLRNFNGGPNTNDFWSGSSWGNNNVELPTKLVGNQWSMSSLPMVGNNVSTQIQDGNYLVIMNTYDKAGNVAESQVMFTVDNSAPNVTIISPIANSTLQTFADLHGTANDNIGVTQITVKLSRKRNNVISYWNGSAFTTTDTTIDASLTAPGKKNVNWDCNAQLPMASDMDLGLYTISATAYDAIGNSTVSTQSFTFQESRSAPDSPFSGSANVS